jgi:dTDP-4-amino-4,6-dideoxygalactose transaminase
MQEVKDFERLIAEYYGAPFAVATDCCTHAIELCLRYIKPKTVTCPKQTYLSVPMTFKKLNLDFKFVDNQWKHYYYIGNTNIIDAAVYWKQSGYEPHTFMCLSFQYRKHLSLGRGGMILLDDEQAYHKLQCMKYDGRLNDIPWKEQDIEMFGYHYYMTPETAKLGIEKFEHAQNSEPRQVDYNDYVDLSKMRVFNAES